MQKIILGVDIGSFNIKLVHSFNNNGKMEILNYAIIKTPEGTINDGRILDIDSIASAIRELLSKNQIKAKQVITLVSSSALVTREVSVPKMDEGDLAKYIKLDSQQYFPMNLEEYVLDFKIMGETIKKEGNELNVLLAAVPEIIVADYIKVFNKLKLDLLAIDITSNVHSKYSQHYLSKKQLGANTLAIIDMGADSTVVSIVSGGALQFNKMISAGCNEITQSIANTYNLDIKEAEEYKLKNAEVIVDSFSAEGLAASISEAIKPSLDNIISQVNKFFEFYYSRNISNKINNIYLLGGGSLLKGADKYYQAAFNIPVRRVDFTDGIEDKSSKPTSERDLPMILNAFAATYRD